MYIISAETPTITHAWRVPGPGPSSIHFLPTDTPLGAAAAPLCPPGCSPLLLITPDRRYGLAMDVHAVAHKGSSTWEGPALQGTAATHAITARLTAAVQGLDGSIAVRMDGDGDGVVGRLFSLLYNRPLLITVHCHHCMHMEDLTVVTPPPGKVTSGQTQPQCIQSNCSIAGYAITPAATYGNTERAILAGAGAWW